MSTQEKLQAALNSETPPTIDPQPIVDAPETPEATPGKRAYKKRGAGGASTTPAADALDVALNDVEPVTTPASKPTRNKKKGSMDSSALGQQLVGVHQLAAMILGVQELQLSPDDGAALGKAIVAICEEYNLSIDGKTGAGLQLFGVAAMIYIPKYFMFRHRIAHETAQALANANAAQG